MNRDDRQRYIANCIDRLIMTVERGEWSRYTVAQQIASDILASSTATEIHNALIQSVKMYEKSKPIEP